MWVGEHGLGRVRRGMLVGGRVRRVVGGVRGMNVGG